MGVGGPSDKIATRSPGPAISVSMTSAHAVVAAAAQPSRLTTFWLEIGLDNNAEPDTLRTLKRAKFPVLVVKSPGRHGLEGGHPRQIAKSWVCRSGGDAAAQLARFTTHADACRRWPPSRPGRNLGIRPVARPTKMGRVRVDYVLTLNRSACSVGLSSRWCQRRPWRPSSSRKGFDGSCSTLNTPEPFHAPLNIIIAPTTGGTPVV
jgi:hypothetical protein